MSDISKIKVDDIEYDLKDTYARNELDNKAPKGTGFDGGKLSYLRSNNVDATGQDFINLLEAELSKMQTTTVRQISFLDSPNLNSIVHAGLLYKVSDVHASLLGYSNSGLLFRTKSNGVWSDWRRVAFD